MRDIHIWLVDKYFLPPPTPSKNRYKIFLDMPQIRLTVFSSKYGEYDKNKRINRKALAPQYRNANWVYVTSTRISTPMFYVSFALSLVVKGLTMVSKPSRKPDVIIASCPDPFQALGALLISKIAKIPLIIDFRDYWPELLAELGIVKTKGIVYKLLFRLTKILTKHSKGIMAAEKSQLEKYLERRIRGVEKPIFIRENIYIGDAEEGGPDVGQRTETEAVRGIEKNIEELKAKKGYVLLITGRQNIKSEDVQLVRKCLETIKSRAGIIALSSDQKLLEIVGPIEDQFIRVHDMLDRRDYLRIISKIDALLSFVTDKRSDFSSNKMYDAICKGKPVLVGVRNLAEHETVSTRVPGVILFDVAETVTIESAFEKLLKIISNHEVKERMLHFCKDNYETQKRKLLEFLEEILEVRIADGARN